MAPVLNIVIGSHVWVADKDLAWIDGEVFKIDGQNAHVRTTKGNTITANVSDIHPKDTEAPPDGVDDMTRLSYLHEPGVLDNLAVRYAKNIIYTYTGNILIAINPFQRLPNLVDVQTMEKYKGANLGDLDPHVFAIADVSYRQMMNEGKSNSILVSGESGAGKTETTKLLMRYLAFLGGRSGTGGRTVEQQVLESNPVLEAFGNAKTVRNNNSSRFGKFVELQFDKSGKISGAAIRTYLLERSRVCQTSSPERNYHCFYFLCSAPSEDIKKYKLGDPSSFHYLNQSSCIRVDGINDAEEYLATRNAMDMVGITEEEQEAIFRVVAAVLHLGNISFAKGTEADSSVIKDAKARFHLNTAGELLMCDCEKLENALIKREINTPEGVITTTVGPNSATVSRDGFAKQIYSRLFDWLVNRINASIGQDPNSDKLIGVLDIYGFESFKTNSFEQLCINFTNEKLQQHFNQNVFKMEQEEYTREQINWSYIEFVDNQDVLDLIEKKPGGIIALLDEACMFPKSTHETLSQKLYEKFKNHKRFAKPKLSRTAFTIQHYAGDVIYQSDHFLDKNKDYVVAEHQELLNASRCSFVSVLFPPAPEENTKSSKSSSIATRFKMQLHELMETLSSTEPHYIRCVKPNSVLKPAIFENTNVLQQLRCSGVLEAIRISCAGYPTRKLFHDFLHRFRILAPEILKENRNDEKTTCQKVLDKIGLEGYQIGRTKVFLRAGQMAELDARRTEVRNTAARGVQSQLRTHVAREQFLILRNASVCLQSFVRARLACKLHGFLRQQAAALKIQKNIRRYFARRTYSQLCLSAITLQTGLRTMAARNEFNSRNQNKASIHIQSRWRRHRDNLSYMKLKRAALTYQCAWRGRVARRELRQLKMAARDTQALKVAKEKLEERVEELMSRLSLEKKLRTDLEKSKATEISKLQSALHDMEQRVEEAAAMKENESAKKAVEEALAQEREKISSLTSEIEGLKVLLVAEREENDVTKKAHANSQERNEELNRKVQDADEMIKQLNDTVKRLEETVREGEALLLTEKQQKEEASTALAESHLRDQAFAIKIEEAEKQITLLQENVERFEYSMADLQSSLTIEKQQHEASVVELAEAQGKIEELLREVGDADEKSTLLETTVQRLEERLTENDALSTTERQESEATKKLLNEVQGKNEELLKKLEDAGKNIVHYQDTTQRLEENVAAVEISLKDERQQNDVIMKQLADAQVEIVELQRNLEGADKRNSLLQDSLQRLDEESTARDALLVAEKQEKEVTKKTLTEALDRIEELVKELECANSSMHQLQDSIQRLEQSASAREAVLLTEHQEKDAKSKALAEAEARIDGLLEEISSANINIDLLKKTMKRLEEGATTTDALYLEEKHAHDQTKKVFSEAQEVNQELLRKVEEADKNIGHLLENVERLEEDVTAKDVLLLTEKQAHEATRKTLVEAQERNEELLKKIHDDDKNILQLQFTIQRLEENTATKENLLLREREQNDATTKAQIESQERSEELLKKFVDVDRKIDLLQDSIERLGESSTTKDALLLSERQEKDAMKKELAEAGERNGELLMKIEDTNEKIEHLQNTIIKLEEDIAAKDVSLEAARQENDSIRKSLTEAQERNEELLRKISDNEYRIHLLQDTVQKIQVDAISRLSSFVMEKQDSDVAKRALTEAQERNEDLLKRNEDLLNRNNDLVKKIEESGKVITHLQESLQRIEGKAANLEAENHVLRQQATATPPSTAKSPPSRSKITRIHRSPENGHVLNGELRQAELRPSAGMSEATPPVGNAPNSSNQKDFEHGEKLQRVLNQKHQSLQPQQPQDDQQWLLTCIPQYLGFSGSKPVATLLIYQCLLHWRSFEAMKTGVFDRILHAINSAIEAEHDVRTLAYWLSNLSALTVLLQRSFKTTRTTLSTPQRRRFSSERTFHTSQTSNAGLAYLGGQSVVGATGLPQVEAKYPALLFKQQLVDLIEKVYGMISDSVKKELNPLLELCIQDPRTSHSNLAKSNTNGLGQQNQLAHWLSIVKVLANYLDVLKANHVPSILVHKLFVQIFSLIDVQLFNRLLLRRECCSFSNGEYVKAGLAELKHWSDNATREFAGSAWEALKHIRQAVDFLVRVLFNLLNINSPIVFYSQIHFIPIFHFCQVISLKPMRTLREIRADVCQALSIQQLERIVGMYLDDVNGSNTISAEFASSLKAAAREEANTVTTFSILLDDDSSIPFSLDDITKTMPIIEMADDDLLPFVRENPGFAFLLQRGE
ncbi:myosin-17 isoform X11 [Triticum aestivum]|uniref:myosin-17 isoform X11 n=1 Tax=Triticum aestivum TaxID=4565 RepID=UPI001D0292D5|nr:myosin-17-like isoform X11 [Triticum aestivum]